MIIKYFLKASELANGAHLEHAAHHRHRSIDIVALSRYDMSSSALVLAAHSTQPCATHT